MNYKKITGLFLKVNVIVLTCFYLIGTFASLTINPMDWPMMEESFIRGLVMVIFIGYNGFVWLNMLYGEDKHDYR